MTTIYKYDLFISYSVKDSPIARRIRDDLVLSDSNLRIYLFEKIEMKAQNFWTEIEDALLHSKNFCLIDSSHARNSVSVARECALAIYLLGEGVVENFIPCMVEDDSDWRNNIKKPKGDYKIEVEDINNRRRLDFFRYTILNHEESYNDEMLLLCDICGFKLASRFKQPEATDFEAELTRLGFDITNIEILLHDFKFFLERAKTKFPTAIKRLEILIEECQRLGFKLSSESIAKLKLLQIPDEIIEKLSSKEIKDKLFITQLDFEIAIRDITNELDFDLYTTTILSNSERGIRFFSLEMALAFSQVDSGDFSKVHATLTHIVEQFPKEARAWNAIGRLQIYEKNFLDGLASQNKALACIDAKENEERTYLQANKTMVVYDKIKALIGLKRYEKAFHILMQIDEKHHPLSSFKYAKTNVLICLGRLEEAEIILAELYRRYSNETENWAAYKLTASKMIRLENSISDKNSIPIINTIVDELYLSKEAFEVKIKKILLPQISPVDFETILNIAKYDRGFNTRGYDIAYLKYELYRKYKQKKKVLESYIHIYQCVEIEPLDLIFCAELASIHFILDLPLDLLLNKGIQLTPERNSPIELESLGKLFFLKGDLPKAKQLLRNASRFEQELRILKKSLPINWREILKNIIDALKILNPFKTELI